MPAASPFMEFMAQYGIWLFPWLFGINLGLSFLGAATAKRRGYSYGGFLCLGIFTSFLIGLIVAACLKPKEGSFIYNRKNVQYIVPAVNSLRCSKCGRVCTADMAYCPGCGNTLYKECRRCGSVCSTDMTYCPNCGDKINESGKEETANNTGLDSSESKTDW